VVVSFCPRMDRPGETKTGRRTELQATMNWTKKKSVTATNPWRRAWCTKPNKRLSQIYHRHEEQNRQHRQNVRNNFFIELNQNPYTIEVTVLPLSFDWKLKMSSWLISTSKNAKIKLGSGNEPHPSGSYI
jgi:hypothetical protein